jgi:hypothetical protein
VFDSVLLAKLDHGAAAGSRELGFETPRFVINTGMDHAAVPASLVQSEVVFLFQKKNTNAGLTPGQRQGAGQAHDTAADDGTIKFHEKLFFEKTGCCFLFSCVLPGIGCFFVSDFAFEHQQNSSSSYTSQTILRQ